jgi:hypothetical protein
MRKIADIILILSIPVLVYLLLVPGAKKEVGFREAVQPAVKTVPDAKGDTGVGQAVSPDNVALLFGWKKKPVKTPENREDHPAVEKPIPAPWVKPLGYAVSPEGKKYYFLKDERSNQVLQLGGDSTDGGWKLLEVTDGQYLLEFEGKKYIVTER